MRSERDSSRREAQALQGVDSDQSSPASGHVTS